jgi:hypothetical protein
MTGKKGFQQNHENGKIFEMEFKKTGENPPWSIS